MEEEFYQEPQQAAQADAPFQKGDKVLCIVLDMKHPPYTEYIKQYKEL